MQLDLFSDIEEINRLREELNEANRLYYVMSAPTMSDREFDQKMRRLQDLEALHPELLTPDSPTQHVGSDLQEQKTEKKSTDSRKQGFQQLAHRYPMLSLQNTYSEQEIRDWYDRVLKELSSEEQLPEVVCEIKYDGLSISLWYENGLLTHALTRGDGTIGDDVLDNIKTIASIPQHISAAFPQTFEIRGEVLLPWKEFERLNHERESEEEPLFANPRNAASGTLKLLDTNIVKHRKLDAYLYYLLAEQLPSDNHFDCLQAARSWGFQVSDAMRVCHSIEEIMQFIDYWNIERKNLPVATDGIVLKINNLKLQQRLGFTAKTPRWAIAFKFEAEKQLTKLKKITYQVGRTGAVTPVANLEPVQLSGTMVRRATLNNEDFIRQLGVKEGDMVWVEKGGEIIPKITGVENSAADTLNFDAPLYSFPHYCPECGAELIRDPEEAVWRCPNEDNCPPQQKGKIEHFVARKAMNIDGLGSETIDMFFKMGLIENIADIYYLTEKDIMRADGFKDKSTRNLLRGIESSKQVPWRRVLFALGIRFVGETTAKKLARRFPSVQLLRSASKEELMTVEDVGEQIAQSIQLYFSKPKNQLIIERLAAAGVILDETSSPSNDTTAIGNALNGRTIVISGTFTDHSRDELKELIELNGGKNTGSVSKNTSFILAGDNMGPQKLEKAHKLGIPLVSEDEFMQMINLK